MFGFPDGEESGAEELEYRSVSRAPPPSGEEESRTGTSNLDQENYPGFGISGPPQGSSTPRSVRKRKGGVTDEEFSGFGALRDRSNAAPPSHSLSQAHMDCNISMASVLTNPESLSMQNEERLIHPPQYGGRGLDAYGNTLLDVQGTKAVANIVVRRDRYYKELEKRLMLPHRGRKTMQRTELVTLYGPRGHGKTSIASDFLREWQKKFGPGRCWFLRCLSRETLLECYIQLGQELRIVYDEQHLSRDEFIRAVHKKLEDQPKRQPWLIVYDEVNEFNLSAFLGGFPASGGSILISTTKREFCESEHIEVNRMSRGKKEEERTNISDERLSAIQMVEKITKEKQPRRSFPPLTRDEWQKMSHYKLAHAADWHPAILATLCKDVANLGLGIEGYLDQRLKEIESALNTYQLGSVGSARGKKLLNRSLSDAPSSTGNRNPNRTERQLQFLREINAETKNKLPKEAREFLEVCAHLESYQIPGEWIRAWITFSNPKQNIGQKEREDIEDAIFSLHLVENVGDKEFFIHGCNRYALKDPDNEVSHKARLIRFMDFLANKCFWDLTQHWKSLQRWAVHVRALSQKRKQGEFHIPEAIQASFAEKMGEHFLNIGIFGKAAAYFKLAKKVYTKLKMHDLAMRANNGLGKVYRHLSSQDRARACFKESLEIFKKVKRPIAYEQARAHRNIAMINYHTNEELEALKHARVAYHLTKQLFNFDKPEDMEPQEVDRATATLSSYALILTSCDKHGFKSQSPSAKKEDRDELASCLCKAAHRSKTELAECLSKMSIKLAKICKLGNLNKTWLFKNHAQVLLKTNPKAALKHAETAHEAHRKSFGILRSQSLESDPTSPPPHDVPCPDEAYFLNTRAHCIAEQGKPQKAIELYEQALKIWSQNVASPSQMPLKIEIVWVLTSIGDMYLKRAELAHLDMNKRSRIRSAQRYYDDAEILLDRIRQKDPSIMQYRQLVYSKKRLPPSNENPRQDDRPRFDFSNLLRATNPFQESRSNR